MKYANYVTMYVYPVHYIINDDVIKTKCTYEGCMQLTYTQHMCMQHARAMHVCKMLTFCILVFCILFCILLYAKKPYNFGAGHMPTIL